jgi:aminoglycoside phosphotransferase (APT) family kinase protein
MRWVGTGTGASRKASRDHAARIREIWRDRRAALIMDEMANPWDAEQRVDEARARELLRAAFPQLPARSLKLLGEGWDNVAWKVDDDLVFRFPRRTLAAQLIESECAILPRLATRTTLPVPDPQWVSPPRDGYPWTFAGYRELPGTPAADAALSPEQRRAAATSLGRFLRVLHDEPIDAARDAGVPADTIRRLDLPHRLGQLRERVGQLVDQGAADDPQRWDAIVDAVPPGWTPGADTLCHGDLYSRHVLVDAGGAPCGVIDWGDVHVGDAAVDLGVAHIMLPVDAHAEFLAAYGDVDDARWAVARFRALHHAVMILLYALDIGDEALAREGRASLELLAEPSTR